MKKRFLSLLLLPLLLIGCQKQDNTQYENHPIEITRKSGEIGDFKLLSPNDGFVTDTGFTFTWEEASNADYYQIEIANTIDFINDPDEVYVRESNIYTTKYDLNFSLQKKDIEYYWRVTAFNKDHKKLCDEIRSFHYNSKKVDELQIEIEDEQDWTVHKEGSEAKVSIDRNNFFDNGGKNSLVISFDKEHTSQGIPKSDGWIVITKSEDRELYGTDSFYFNFYYTGHDATVLIRVLDDDGEYWHKQVQISNNAKQTILMKYEDFELRTAGTNINNREFDWFHIRYFEIVFERTFGDGVCILSDIKAVKYDDYKHLFMDKMDFRISDPKDWTYENYDFDKTISEDGSEITLGFTKKDEEHPDGFNGYGFQNVNLYKFFASGDAIRLKVKYTGASSNAMFYFRILEEDMDRWQFKTSFSYLIKDEYKELIVPLKAFQRTDYMQGDGAKQFYFVQKLNFGLADNYSSGTLSIKDLEIIKLDDVITDRKRVVGNDGLIEDFNNYNIYTEIYYYWEQSTVNKDEAMKLDNIHKAGGTSNPYCGEFDYKADMEMATYQLYMNTTSCVGKNALSLWLKDAAPLPDDPMLSYLKEEDVTAEMTIQLTMDTGEWYRYIIPKVTKEWNNYTILFEDFFLENGDSLFDEPNPLSSDHIIHMGIGLKYFFYDQQGKAHPTYAIANPLYLDEMYFVNATETSIEEVGGTIKPDTDDSSKVTIETFEGYSETEDLFENWSYGNNKDYNDISLSDEVSSIGGSKSIKMHYKSYDSVSYVRNTPFAKSVMAKGFALDIKSDGKATIYLNLNWRSGTKLYKMRYTLTGLTTGWTHCEFGFSNFKDIDGSSKTISQAYAKDIETISFGIVNNDYTASDIYVDNMRLLNNITYSTNTVTVISQKGDLYEVY